MDFESFEQKTGVERVYETSTKKALKKLGESYKEDVIKTAQEILNKEGAI